MPRRTICAVALWVLAEAGANGQILGVPTPHADTNAASVIATLLFPENAYNPIPSPDGRFIAYVATGWGSRSPDRPRIFGMGRASLVSDVELADAAGKVLAPNFCPDMFLAGWTQDSRAVVCYRDGQFSVKATDGAVIESGDIPRTETWPFSERVSFLSDLGRTVWLEYKGRAATLRTNHEVVAQLGGEGALLTGPRFSEMPLISASPNGRYVGMMPSRTGQLWIYDRVISKWSYLGLATVSPAEDWAYIQPSWDPWFADSSQVVYFDRSELILSSPDGRKKRVVCKTDQPVGLPAASPDAQSVAYVSFESRPMTLRPDLRFWAIAGVWIIPASGGSAPRMLTGKTPDTNSGIRWLGNSELLFDQISESLLAMHARIWKIHVH
jgi:hypothetical protein